MNGSNKLTKRLLIVSTWAPPMVGGPQNLYNLFSQIQDNYSIITSRAVLEHYTRSGMTGSWLPCTYYAYEGGQISGTGSTSTPPVHDGQTRHPVLGQVVQAIGKIPWLGSHMVQFLSVVYQLVMNPRVTRKIVSTKGINLLFGVSDMGPALITTWLTSRRTKVPYVLYLFDLYRGNNFSWPYSWLARWLENSILTNARLVVLTNEMTQKFYQHRYGTKIRTAVVHNSIFDRRTVNSYQPVAPFTIVFTGNVYWPQKQAVMNLLAAMDRLRDLPLTLHLYVPNPSSKLQAAILGKNNIKLSAASQDEMPRIQGAATLLFLPLAWNTKAPDIIATATPGKFTDYLASGRPMLVHAPEYAYVSQYTKEHDLGIVVNSNSVDALVNAIRSFLTDPSRGRYYVDNAMKIFAANHEATKNAEKLTKILNLI